MVSVYQYDNYRAFLNKWLKSMPREGYGKISELARFLNVHTTLVSQVFKGHKELTSDQAALVTQFLGLNELETEYFVSLVHFERAGNSASKDFYAKQMNRVKGQAASISRRVTVEANLTEEQRAVFYSDWAYSAIRQSVALPKMRSVEAIAKFLDLPRDKVRTYLDFLIRTGLCKLAKDQISVGPSSTHVSASSPWVRVHHSNWRQRALQSLDSPCAADLHYTLPLTLSGKDSELLREKILQFIESTRMIVDPSPSEAMFCLNIDWFQVAK